jgi:2-phospho-L-lactate guanylyltransferase
MPDVAGADPPWAIIVPVKRFAEAKTRLGLPPQPRAALALALAVDTMTAAARAETVRRLLVVTDEAEAAEAARALGAVVVADEPAAGLNPALRHGAAIAVHDGATAVAALSSDLPALDPADLDATLRRASAYPVAFVADAAGTGTTLLTAGPGRRLEPSFGSASRAAHLAAGGHDLSAEAGRSLRRDVDTPADLLVAAGLGVGRETAAWLEAHGSLLERP